MDQIQKEFSIDQKLINYIKSQSWGNFDNKGMDLLVRSIQLHGFRKIQKKYPYEIVLEDILLYHNADKQLKVFSLKSSFTKEVTELYKTTPNLVTDHIEKSFELMKRAENKISQAQTIMCKNDIENLIGLTKEIIEIFFEISYWKYYISAISRKIYTDNKSHQNINSILEKIYEWKNNPKYYNLEGNSLIEISHFLAIEKNMPVHGWEIVKYLHLDEFFDFLDGKISGQKIANLIRRREKTGYISFNLDHPKYANMLLCNSTPEAQEIKKHIDFIFIKTTKQTDSKIIQGQSIIKSNAIIRGKCIVITNQKHLSDETNLHNKIIVTTMSTPGLISYIKNVRAIITDTGGIISHVAIIAREYDIPCIIGTNIATTFLETGDLVELNMENGMIRKLT